MNCPSCGREPQYVFPWLVPAPPDDDTAYRLYIHMGTEDCGESGRPYGWTETRPAEPGDRRSDPIEVTN